MVTDKKIQVIRLSSADKVNVGDVCTCVRHKNQKPLIFGEFDNSYPEECIKQELYFLSDEDIEKGDWVICECFDGEIRVIHWTTKGTQGLAPFKNHKKIIATTDKSLILPQPSQTFLKDYCYRGGVDEVLVEYELVSTEEWYGDKLNPFKLKEEKLKINPHDEITIHVIKTIWRKEDLIGNNKGSLDSFLLNSSDYTQEEREIIMDAISDYIEL